MSSSVEDEIVSMKFENSQFEKAASTSLNTLDKLKKSLVLPANAMGNGLSDISKNMRGFHMNPLVDSASEVGRAFSAMSVIAISAIATIASQATQAGLGIVKSLSIAPITQGFSEYETQIGSVQTILANTGLEGEKGLAKVTASLDELNEFSDRTIYNFTQMAKNIGTFTAAGVDLDVSTAAIKGIANLAAVSGSTAEQASTAMYQLSQALASGTVKLMDWNSVVNAGMGGQVFKDALMETARVHGIAIDDMIKKDGSFRETLQEGWLTSNVLTETLAKFTGDLSREQLKSQGYTKKQIDEIIKLGTMANDAATKVKTLTQLMSTLKEAVGSGWAQTWKLIFGDFNEAKGTFTAASDVLGEFIKHSADARNKVLADWAALGGRTKLISAISNAFKALMSVIEPIHDAFREIFPAKTGMELKNLTKSLNQFFRAIRLSTDAQEDLKNTFAGLFAVMHIAFTIISGIAHVLGTLIGLFFKSQGSTLAFTGGIGQMLVALDAFLTKGEFVENFFNGLATVLVALLGPVVDLKNALIGAFADLVTGDPSAFFDGIKDSITIVLQMVDDLTAAFANVVNTISDAMGGVGHIQGLDLASMFGGTSGVDAKKGIDEVKGSLSGLATVGETIHKIWSNIADAFRAVGTFLAPLTAQFSTVFGAIKDQFSNLMSGKDIDFDQVLEAINTGLFLAIFLQFRKFSNALSGISTAAEGVLKQVTSNLKSMQAEVRAAVILQIAIALVLLAGAIFLLSKTDPKKLGAALVAVTIMLGELVGALKLLEAKIGKGEGLKLILVATAMTLMAVAIAAMAGAVFLFSKIPFKDMQKGMLGVTEAIALLTASAAIISKSGGGANMIGAAIGLTIMSAALVALAGAIKLYSMLDPHLLADGLIKVAATIVILALAMNLMKTGVSGAAAMFIVAGALTVLTGVLGDFAAMSKGDILKSLLTLGLALGILVVAMNAMTGGIAGAGALLLMAAALTVLGPAIVFFGTLDWATVGKGLLIIIGAMLALSLAAAAMSPVIPLLFAMGAAIALIGAAVFLAGTGVLAFASGLALLAHNGTAGFDILIDLIHQFLQELPLMVSEFGDTIGAIADVIGDKAPEMIDAFVEILSAMLDAGLKLVPKMGQFMTVVIKTLLKVIVSYYSDLAEAGLNLLINIIQGIGRGIPRLLDAAGDVAIAFIKGMGKQAVRLANAGLDALIDFLNGLADAIESHSAQINNAGARIAVAIIAGITQPLRSAGQQILDAIQAAWDWAKDHFKPKLSIGGHDIIGRMSDELTGSFAHLVGGIDEVSDALDSIKTQIKDTLEKSGEAVDKWTAKLKDLKKSGGSPKQIEHAKKMLEAAEALQKDAEAANKAYTKRLKGQREQLVQLAKDYDAMLAKIADAEDALKAAQDSQTSFKNNVISTFSTVPDIQAGQSLASYMRQLAAQQKKVEKFKATLAALAAAGLDSTYLQQFLTEGLDAQKVMDQLLAGGPGAIDAFEQSSAGLTSAGQALADMASNLLGYDAAVKLASDTLAGLRDGLGNDKDLKLIEDQMTNIAKLMMKAIKKHLDIKSPSRKAAEVGLFFIKGLVNQMDGMHRDVEKSSAAVGAVALDTLQSTMQKMGEGVNSEISMSPVISPVLDLAQLSRDASRISSLIAANPITAGVSFAQASDISISRQADQQSDQSTSASKDPQGVNFEQTIISPKPLDDVEIWRNTHNLLSLAKEALGV